LKRKPLILGAGMTGLAAGYASGFDVLEARAAPGGICSSYYVRPGSSERLARAPEDGDAYRFEIGGGHWIFGGDPFVHRLIDRLAPVRRYARRSSVWLPARETFVDYPLQNNLRALDAATRGRAIEEMLEVSRRPPPVRTMADWLRASFGPTLCELFFEPFHELYTAGLYPRIAPQDAYKSPVELAHVVRGAFADAPPAGYNATFVYPAAGLDELSRRLAKAVTVHYGKRVVRIDVGERVVHCDDGSAHPYEELISTLPLSRMVELTGVGVEARPDPSPAVLVLNLGARKGPRCPPDQWVYVPHSGAGFHRVGFYNHVDASFLPAPVRDRDDRVSVYVEKAYPEGATPSPAEVDALSAAVCKELEDWQWIGEVEVVDPTWIETAYTWSWPGSTFRREALDALGARGIHQVGRYARWVFQGIADSLRDGLVAGGALRG
jgi:protoporphyrinogen oxidase